MPVSKHFLLFVIMLITIDVSAQDSLQSTVLRDVVVTGQFEPQSIRKSVYQVRTISYDRIVMRAPTNVQSVLSTELGIRFGNDLTLGTADISLMGMSGQNVKILLDGVPLLDRGATRESLNQIDVNTVERIEIVEGPLSVVYGTDALAGVINIITRKYGENNLSIEARVQEETAGDEYDFFGDKGVHQENLHLNWQGKRWNVGGGVTRNNSGGWEVGRNVDPLVTTEWNPKDQWLADATTGFKNDKVNVWYRLNYLKETIFTTGNTNPNTNIAIDKDYKSDRFNHQLQADWRINNKWSFNGAASFQDYVRRTLTTLYNETTGERRLSPEPGTQDESKFKTTMFRGMMVYTLSEKISLQPGVDINLSEGYGDRIDRRRSINDYALFISSEFRPTSFVNIRPGFRFTSNSAYDAPPVIPSLNTKFTLSKTVDWRIAYAYGFRAPALRELYFYFFDASHSIKGNPNLKAEYSNSFSTSLSWQIHNTPTLRVNSVLAGFYNQFENLIELGYDPADPQVNTYVNIYRNRTTGGTLENSFNAKNVSGSLGFSYIGAYNLLTADDSSLPSYMWTPEVNATASYMFEKTNTRINAFYKYTGVRARYETVGSDIRLAKTNSFHLLDATVVQRITSYLDITLGVKNILDVTNLRNTSTDTGGAHSTGGPVPFSYGRSWFTSLNFHLTK